MRIARGGVVSGCGVGRLFVRQIFWQETAARVGAWSLVG